jgi:hypothetical protein
LKRHSKHSRTPLSSSRTMSSFSSDRRCSNICSTSPSPSTRQHPRTPRSH